MRISNQPIANERLLHEGAVAEAFLETPTGDSFADLFKIFSPQLVAFFRARGCALALAEDLSQEVMLTVYCKASQIRERTLFRAWLFKIARNALYRHYGKQAREVETVDMDGIPDRLVAASLKPAGTPAFEFLHWMAFLDSHEREAMALRFIEQWEYHEIAAAQSKPIGTVQSRIFSAKKKLALRLTRHQNNVPQSRLKRTSNFWPVQHGDMDQGLHEPVVLTTHTTNRILENRKKKPQVTRHTVGIYADHLESPGVRPTASSSFHPRKHVSQVRLQIVRLSSIHGSGRFAPLGHRRRALARLVHCQALAFLAQLHGLIRHLNQIPGSLQLVIASLDLNSYLFTSSLFFERGHYFTNRSIVTELLFVRASECLSRTKAGASDSYPMRTREFPLAKSKSDRSGRWGGM